jgi:hypothetical protein
MAHGDCFLGPHPCQYKPCPGRQQKIIMFAHSLQLRLSASTNYLVHLLGDSFAQVQMATQQQILNTFRFDVFVCVCVLSSSIWGWWDVRRTWAVVDLISKHAPNKYPSFQKVRIHCQLRPEQYEPSCFTLHSTSMHW